MMEQVKAIFYDEDAYLKRGMYAGLVDGKPVWVNITEGDTSTVLDYYIAFHGDSRLLCLEGERPSSLTVVKWIANNMSLAHSGDKSSFEYCLQSAKEFDITWNQDPLALRFEVGLQNGYILVRVEEDAELPDSYTEDQFTNLRSVFVSIRAFREFLETEAGIKITRMGLSIFKELEDEMTDEEKDLFYHIDNEVII